MEEYLTSSEAFAKALKGAQTSPTEKIRLAKEAWRRADVVLPHKQEFLLEWLCNVLVKASTPSKNPKDTLPNTLLDQEYWDLFKDMLRSITRSRKGHSKGRILGLRHQTDSSMSGPNVGNNQTPGVLLRVPVIPMFTVLVQKLSPQSSPAPAPTPSKSNKKSKSPASTSSKESDVEQPSSLVLESAFVCFDLLSSPVMAEWFQPTLEQYTPLVQAILEALIALLQDTSDVDRKKQQIVLQIAHVVLDRFRRLVIIQPNQKKVFGLVAGKLFEPLVRARVAIRMAPESLTRTECQDAIGAILRTGLFHQEHLQEYTAGYVVGDEKSLQSYQKQLFEQIATLAKSNYATAVLDVLPVLLCYFIEETRRKQRHLASSGFDRGLDSARETEFSFFKIIYVLAKKQLPELTEQPSEASIGHLCDIMEALNSLLSTILDLNIYQPSNNEAADQYVFMSTSFGSIYSCLTTAKTLENGRLQCISLAGIVVLSQLDDRLLKPHLDSLWPILLSPFPEAKDAALELARTLLVIYGKSSDFKTFLTSFLSSLREFVTQPTLLHIPANVRSYLPLPQAPTILDIFVTELMTLDSGLGVDGLEPMQDLSQKKKRKLNSGKSKDHSEGGDGIRSAEFVVIIFIQFLKGLRVTANQEKQLNKEFKVVYNHFLEQIFKNFANRENKDDYIPDKYQARRITPALMLHYALSKVSTQYWMGSLSFELMDKIVENLKSTSGYSDAVILTLNRVVLQHVHLTLCTAEMIDEDLAQRCRGLVRFTMKNARLTQLLEDNTLVATSWNGQLESATNSAFLVASWQIQVNEWLDIVCRFGTQQHMEEIAEVIAKQFSSAALSMLPREPTTSTDSITIQLLNQTLLRSANFYEVPNFRPIFAKKILQGLAESIKALSSTDAEKKLAVVVASFTETHSTSSDATAPKATFADALKELVDVTHQEPGKTLTGSKPKPKSAAKTATSQSATAEEQGTKLLSLLSIMHLLPLEYFEKFERNIILTTMAVLDAYIQRYLVADPAGIKCLLLERRISNAIMTWRSDAGVLFNGPALLLNLLDYPSWNCSTAYGSEDKDGLGLATMETTSAMTDSAIRFYMAQTHDPIQSEAAIVHLSALLKVAMVWANESLDCSYALVDGGLTDSRIKTVILSRVCQSIVHYLGQRQHQKSTSSKKSKTANTEMEDARGKVLEMIEELFKKVQTEVEQRIKKVMTVLKANASNEDLLVEVALKGMDHFELYKTIVQYSELDQDEGSKNRCLESVPGLFELAKALTRTSRHDVKESRESKERVVHLTATLTGYSCQYLPLTSSWKSSTEFADKTMKELLVLLLGVSGQELSEKDVTLLKQSYLSMLGQLSEDLVDSLLHWLLEEAVSSREHAQEELVLVRYLDATFLSAHHTQKRKVRRQVSKLLTQLTRILQMTQSVQVVIGVLNIVAGICSESSFELRSWEIGLALETIVSLMSPATPLLSGPTASATALTNYDTSQIFTAVYHILINTARFRQEELTTLIPVFTSILQGMVHGFKSLHASIAKRQQGVESLVKSPFMLLSVGSAYPSAVGRESLGVVGSAAVVNTIGDPLPVECAENFSRLLTALGSKGVSSFSSHGGGNSATEESSVSGGGGGGGSFTVTTDASKAFGKHAPYILMEYFAIQSSVVASISQQSLRSALLPGLYALLNLCSDWEREMMMVGLDNTGKTLLKGLYADYLKYHKYTGR
ncbi:hypothetical protein BGZ70_004720 [Mortierella alpina]|uniref:Nucleolar 27S pre-rRNA processing Urb2/Npa2 C-terminal domain-containing protein n=1 Tax=Mortierella alpina TaxID=64518 RepID=A0A9P6JCZ7_MORAP|nr:hypothetical protein BGZ70_004720 [Mortierella alpina]